MEERVGERRLVCFGLPLSSVLSPLLRRGERKKKRVPKSLSQMRESSSLCHRFSWGKTVHPAGDPFVFGNLFLSVCICVHLWFRFSVKDSTAGFRISGTTDNVVVANHQAL
jgi:hypothetical protein